MIKCFFMKSSSWVAITSLSFLSLYLMSAPTARSSGRENTRAQPSLQQKPDARNLDTEQILRLNSLGVALMEQLKFEEAAHKFTEIIQLDNRFAPGYVNLGIARFNLQDYEKSLQSLGQAIQIDPDQIHAHYVRGLIYRNQDKPEMAVGEFEAVRKQDPEDPSTNYYLGLLSSRQRNYDQTIEYLTQVIEREPYNASAHYNLAIAFLRSGKRAEGEKEMGEFRRLQGLFGATTIGLQYLEQGKYAAAIDQIPTKYLPDLGPPPSVEPIRVTFTEVSTSVKVQFRHAGPARTSFVIKSRKDLEDRLVPFLGSGIAFVDYDSDGWLDLFVANAGSMAATGALFKNLGKGMFAEITSEAGIEYSGKTMSALWGDFNNDASPDLYLINYGPNVLYQNNSDGTFSDVTETAGVADSSWGFSGAWVDFDHDGDLDLFVSNFSNPDAMAATAMRFPDDLPGADNVLYRNNGDGTFSDVAVPSGLSGGALRTAGAICTDFDNSRDIDFYLVNLGAPNQLFSNLRDGTFVDISENGSAAGVGHGVGLGIGDINRDGFMDLVLPSSPDARLLINSGSGLFKSVSLPEGSRYVYHAEIFDFDNDADQDMLLVAAPLFQEAGSANEKIRNFFLLENRQGEMHDASARTGLSQFTSLPLRGVSSGDFDNDGDLDVAVNVNGSSPLLLRNDGGNQNNWVEIRTVATNSNAPGIGTKVELKSGRLYQKTEVYGGSGFLGQSPARVHFGLGKKERIDMIRLVWPGGVLQSEIDQAINQTIEIRELDRKGTSCPILYLWDGMTYRFQTDFLGGSAYGYLVAPGVYNYPDTDEYIKLDRDQVALKDGKLAITLNNQLEEVILFDQLELVAIDHPAEYQVYPDEKLLPGPPYQGFRLFTVSRTRPLAGAWDRQGASVLSEVSGIDRIYPDLFQNLPFKGYAEHHEIVLDLGSVPSDGVVLLAHAWIDYADSTSNLAAHQAGHFLIPPYLQVLDEQGRWVTVLDRMGFPAGMPKTMTVDLSGKFLSHSRKVRIVTNMRVHWDQILVGLHEGRRDYRLMRLAPDSADLHFRGFPAFFSPDGHSPKVYRHNQASATAPWKVHIGAYTRYGEVRPLLTKTDDLFVITRSGDEIEAFFEVNRLPKLPLGWVRDYLVYVDGFGKDMDINSASPDYVGPLPFHGMSAYPYPPGEQYPSDPEHGEYQRTWNTRTEENWTPSISDD